MKTQVQSLGFDAQPSLLQLVDKKLEKIAEHSHRILEGKVVFKLDKSDTRENKICEIRLVIPGNDLFAKKVGATFEEALDHVTRALEKQVSDWKTRLQDRQVKVAKS